MKQGSGVTAVDSSTDRVCRCVDNGVCLDGRAKTLKECGLGRQHQVTPSGHINKNKESKDKEVEVNISMANFCIKEHYLYNKWMEH